MSETRLFFTELISRTEVTNQMIFENELRAVCKEVLDTVLEKNRKYGDSFRQSRFTADEKWGSRKIPFDFHANEKIARYAAIGNDDEDSVLDLIGYGLLEVVCRRLDDGSH